MKKTIAVLVAVAMVALRASSASTPVVLSSKAREGESGVRDIVFKVVSSYSNVNVRVLAYTGQKRSVANVLIPSTFVADQFGNPTSGCVGDGIEANVEHTLSWDVLADSPTADVSIEILVSEIGTLPMELVTIPAVCGNSQMEVSINEQSDENVYNALLWYYACRNAGLVKEGNKLNLSSGQTVVTGKEITDKYLATKFVFAKMGYMPLTGVLSDYASVLLRKWLPYNSHSQHGYRLVGSTDVLHLEEQTYCVIDISSGANSDKYPISYLNAVPLNGWSDEYKTKKILLRRIEPGSYMMGDIKPVTFAKPFYIGVFEITQAQYELVMESGCNQRENCYPVHNVNWDRLRGTTSLWPNTKLVESNTFIGRLQTRTGIPIDLPTEAQWEYAAFCGRNDRCYNGGDSRCDAMHLGRFRLTTAYYGTAQVGQYLPNDWGIYDTLGNVREWCLDRYGELEDVQEINPEGPFIGDSRVIRGSNNEDLDQYVIDDRVRRFSSSPSSGYTGSAIGFRIAWDLSRGGAK